MPDPTPAATLPPFCYARLPSTGETIVIVRGEAGYHPTTAGSEVEDLNAALSQPPTPEQVEAMLAGSMFGWHVPLTNPGQPRANTPAHSAVLVSPIGTAIRGTLEQLTGIAACEARRGPDGSVEIEHLGGTEVDLELAVTLTRAGPRGPEAVFIDEDGYEWQESDLVEPSAASEVAAAQPPEWEVFVIDWGSLDTCFRVDGRPDLYQGRSEDLDRLWDYCKGHLGWNGWLRVVNERTRELAGCCLLDLPARDWRDEYDGRVPPDEAADVAVDEYASVHGTAPVRRKRPTPSD